jgi:hypothetical protein
MADYIGRPLTAAPRPVTPHAEVGFEEATVRQAPTTHCHCQVGVRVHQEQYPLGVRDVKQSKGLGRSCTLRWPVLGVFLAARTFALTSTATAWYGTV